MKLFGDTDYSALDRPEVLDLIFYPRPEFTTPKERAGEDLRIPVEEGVELGARFHDAGEGAPTLLFFHGNGEIVADYDELAPLFVGTGANFLPVDYRGYGLSSGTPSVSAMMKDCHRVFEFARDWLQGRGYSGPVIAAGRSLGSASALELAAVWGYPELGGLFVESGFARMGRILALLGLEPRDPTVREEIGFRNLEKIRRFVGPTLLIHGEMDQLIPLENARALLEAAGSPRGRLLVIPGADHNTVLLRGLREYVRALSGLVREASERPEG